MRAAAWLAAAATLVAVAVAVEPGAGAAGARPCSPASLSASFGGQGATETLLGTLVVTNHARTPCRLKGRPAITLAGGSPHEVLSERPMRTATMFPGRRFGATLVLDPGRSASVAFQWANWCKPGASGPAGATALGGRRPSQVLVRIAPGAAQIAATVRAGLRTIYLPVCNDPSAPSSLLVSLWTAGGG